MDTFWVAHAGVDPVKLLEKYPSRWRLLHLKDIRLGAAVAVTRSAPREDNVALGSGQIDWPAFLRAAERAGVEYYFIEDEGAIPSETIPASLRYLHSLQY
ncbi:MAG: sugar phosphate isomerase/epimerase [Opitutaceae bacterium]|nr:sugar phosphate isomerase/epimerase [Opitutaceae bacterium]